MTELKTRTRYIMRNWRVRLALRGLRESLVLS